MCLMAATQASCTRTPMATVLLLVSHDESRCAKCHHCPRYKHCNKHSVPHALASCTTTTTTTTNATNPRGLRHLRGIISRSFYRWQQSARIQRYGPPEGSSSPHCLTTRVRASSRLPAAVAYEARGARSVGGDTKQPEVRAGRGALLQCVVCIRRASFKQAQGP